MNSVRTDTKTASLDAYKKQLAEMGIVFNILTSPIFWLTVGFLLSAAAATGKPMQNDEGLWTYIGRLWAENKTPPYIGAVDNKAPGIYTLFYISHLFFGTNIWFPRTIGVLAIGIGGSIGWSQYFKDLDIGPKFKHQKIKLFRKLSRLIPYSVFSKDIKGFTKIKYKILRSRVPHPDINPSKWLKQVILQTEAIKSSGFYCKNGIYKETI